MALPTLVKTWQYNVNQTIAASGSALTNNRRLLRAIKDSLLGFALGAWTTYYSCDSVTAGTPGDGVDRWGADGNLVWAGFGAAHSWYVLKQTNITTNYQILITLETTSATGSVLGVFSSASAGFTGGTATARPTATDEVTVLATNSAFGGNATNVQQRLHVMMSNDGQCTRIVMHDTNVSKGYWMFDKVQSSVTGWNYPAIGYAKGNSTTTSIITSTNIYASTSLFKGYGTVAMDIYLCAEGRNNAALCNVQTIGSSLGDGYPMFALGVGSDTPGNRGRHGRIVDLYFGLANNVEADTYPGDGSNQFVQFGILIFPWNGTAPGIT